MACPVKRPASATIGRVSRRVPLTIQAEVRLATTHDLPALGTWSGHVNETFAPALERGDRALLVAVANGGFPIGHLLVDLSGILSHLVVLRGFRDQGLGTGLVAEGEALLRERKIEVASLMVEKTNENAIRLYERLGYARRGETEEIWPELVDGAIQPVAHPSWVMSRRLL
jgi:ribosomal protein S18 acetylase RimI-like enzyme